MANELKVGLKIRPLTGGLLVIIAILVVLHLLDLVWWAHHHYRLDRWGWVFNLGYEDNVPTLFSFCLLALAGLTLVLIGHAVRHNRARFAWHWTALGAIFFYLAADEVLMLHEAMGKAAQSLLHTSGFLYFGWYILYLPLVLVLAIVYIGFFRALPKATLAWFVAAAVLYIGAAAGLEIFESDIDTGCPVPCWTYQALNTVEEALEMVGVVVFLRGLWGYMANPERPFKFFFETQTASRRRRASSTEAPAHHSEESTGWRAGRG